MKQSQRFSRLQIGIFLMLMGPIQHVIQSTLWPLEPPLSNEEMGQAFGRAFVTVRGWPSRTAG